MIQAIHRPGIATFDRWVWTLSVSGKFTTKSAYWLDQARFQSSRCRIVRFWKRLWSSSILPRHKLFWWLCLQNSLSTCDRIAHLFPIPDSSYPLCNNGFESPDRLFYYCPWAANLWMMSQWSINSLARLGNSV